MTPYWTSKDGRHVLYNADCLEVLPTLSGVDAVVTDPPYNTQQPNITANSLRNPGANPGRLDFGEWDKDFDCLAAMQCIERTLSIDGQAYVFASDKTVAELLTSANRLGFATKLLQWIKPDPLPQCRKRHWTSAAEHVVWMYRGSYVFNFGEQVEMYTWQKIQAPKIAGERVHPTQKPLKLIEKYIGVSTDRGQLVLDPFTGSGTTGVACIRTGRRFIGIEISREYCDIAVKRMERELSQPRLPGMEPERITQLSLLEAV